MLFCALAAVLWLGGGGTRADASGQLLVRLVATVALIAAILFGPPGSLSWSTPKRPRVVAAILGATILLVLLQLVPLPPALWQGLPGREMFAQAAALTGQPQPWRPLSIVPGATINAAAALIVPLAVLVLATGLSDAERSRVPAILLCMVLASALLGLLQFSGAALRNPLVAGNAGQVGGIFANRNHFAIFLACGCLLAPVWAFLDGRRPGWRAPVALGLVLLFTLTILANGSRAGLLVGVVALGLGAAIVQQGIRTTLQGYPKWTFPALVAGVVGLVVILVLLTVAADRAVSIQRIFSSDVWQDMRGRGFPTVVAMIEAYFPFGAGFGGFDPLFRIHEPFDLLKPTYFNHAHNDWLEVVLDGGVPALLLLSVALGWWAVASMRAWRAGPGTRHALPKLGSAVILLILIASIFDYPARTPMIMAVITIAAIWLSGRQPAAGGSTLPTAAHHL